MLTEELALEIATFRFGIISEFVTGVRLAYGERERLLRQKTERSYQIPGSTRTTISRAAIMGWIGAYKAAGNRLDGLRPKRRSDIGGYRNLDQTLRTSIRELKQENPTYTLPTILNKLKHQRLITPDERINLSTLYRFIRQEKLNEAPAEDGKDRRRFEAAYPNEIWQCDVMHGPLVREVADGPQRKAYLCAIMDDHSRLIVAARFYLNETFASLKECLQSGIERRGIPQRFYVDNGSCYRSTNLEQILAGLGIALTHSRPYTPQGRGKIERWFRSIRDSFLPLHGEDGQLLGALNERLGSWVDTYNGTVHSVTKATPYERFKANLSCVRPAPGDLLSHFRLTELRKVKKDRSIQLMGQLFEAPVRLIDKSVELRFHPETPLEVEIFHEGLSYGQAVFLDSRLNSRLGRDFGDKQELKTVSSDFLESPTEKLPRSGELFGHSAAPESRGEVAPL